MSEKIDHTAAGVRGVDENGWEYVDFPDGERVYTDILRYKKGFPGPKRADRQEPPTKP